ncbi:MULTISPECIES: ADP-ribosylglycohydrolase family protein [Micromonospora]|uniref:ADP-ribosylglycohydrolase family protein n=1 Tax=Micromonospora TaxID=1873 RepID=UPI0018DDDBC4|nr:MULTISPECIES: ADP-ribosylglycohydrolase family protein [Micromonospora]MCK1806838.1 ADP-ribosylglycohydrolase family protein [Micromonospora sp. R42106]MCK1833670.1 ADP-ribosylglycohydrolase family protein [Micromonospora sp. R42003]MCK1846103.1 ADP-ribosylglycohydrolase family protein [Micromonospora sp. R42004]MCM1018784.1 ADP-ribosylglycohydrolase family protein [Micromonospora sp. XM-20-01]
MTRVTAEQLATARGCVLGLMLGDAVGVTGGHLPTEGPLRATSAGQLACFTIEGIIRADVRGTHKGICHPPSVVWHAYTRWASKRGIPGIRRWQDEDWPDGWLAQVPALSVHRGSAPATVSALQVQPVLDPDKDRVWTSVGAHGLTRALPAGLVEWWHPEPGRFAAELAATTHGPEAVDAAAVGATMISAVAKGHGVEESVERAQRGCHSFLRVLTGRPLAEAAQAAREHPRDPEALTRLVPDGRALSALAGAVYVALSFPGRGQLHDALLFAASAPHGRHAAATVGALLGARHGVNALPVGLVSRLELAWVADVLARDLLAEFVDRPSGTEYTDGSDPDWWDRYPGW